jgi:hypothetical protein
VLLRFKTAHPETSEPIEVIADHLPAQSYQDREMPDDPEEIVIKDVISRGKSIYFADIETELERLGFEKIKQLKRSQGEI